MPLEPVEVEYCSLCGCPPEYCENAGCKRVKLEKEMEEKNKEREEEDGGGYTLVNRSTHRAEHGHGLLSVTTGDENTCLPDATESALGLLTWSVERRRNPSIAMCCWG